VSRRHWTLLKIDIDKRTAFFYDSYDFSEDDKRSVAQPVLNILSFYVIDNIKFALEIVKAPLQKNGYDCGMFVLAFTFQLAQGLEVRKVSQRQIPSFRKAVLESAFTGKLGNFSFK
jgi:Ulp1 family protease